MDSIFITYLSMSASVCIYLVVYGLVDLKRINKEMAEVLENC